MHESKPLGSPGFRGLGGGPGCPFPPPALVAPVDPRWVPRPRAAPRDVIPDDNGNPHTPRVMLRPCGTEAK